MSTAEQRQEWARLADPALLADVDRLTAERDEARKATIDNAPEWYLDAVRVMQARHDAERDALRNHLNAADDEYNTLAHDNAALSEALDTALLHLKESEAERDALAGQLAKVDEYSAYCYGATDGRWRMSFAEWQEAVKNDAQPQA
jgi:hypothetical protein